MVLSGDPQTVASYFPHSMKINRYRRSDGVPFAAEEGSATDEICKRDGSFVPCDESGNEIVDAPIETSNENDAKTNKSALDPGKEKTAPGQSGSGKRGGARGRNKEKDAAGDKEGSAVGKDVSPEGSDVTGQPTEPASGTPEVANEPEPGNNGGGVPSSIEEGPGSGN